MKDKEIVIRRTHKGVNIEKHIKKGKTKFFELTDEGKQQAILLANQKGSYRYKCYDNELTALGYCVPK